VAGVAAFIAIVAAFAASNDSATATSPGRIVFVSNRAGTEDIWAMTPDGYGQTNLTNTTSSETLPSISPDGSRIAFATDRDGDYEVYSMDADGSNPANLSNSAASTDAAPVWSPNGSQIAFYTDRDGQVEIYLMDADGSDQVNITNTLSSNEGFPAWSPDGSQIVFMTDRDGDLEIYSMDADGSNQTNLTNAPTSIVDMFPAWSPDGLQIAFVSERDGNREIYVMDADGSNPTRLTFNDTNDNVPTFSPDGTKIAYEGIYFTAPNTSNGEVFVMDADGNNPRNLTNSPNGDGFPSWSSVPGPDNDTDGDGCTDAQEAGISPLTGGQRNSKTFWDYGDMPLETAPGSGIFVRSGKVRVDDILTIVDRYFADDAGGTAPVNRNSDPLSAPPPTGYHPAFDRGAQTGVNAWNVAAPDGQVLVNDILFVVKQYFHDCL
jgi:TolB protein